ncbi:MAG: DegT/DnrJ/EryC1/StrS family aminotransferase [Rhodocyclaceae bacterium]|nr:DegT/DnrJ/EryC1/StrS family aminotransferase [Rhodocyclaceae bacterium]
MRPQVDHAELEPMIRAILESGRLTSGPTVERFESMVAAAVGARHAIATTSATTALHLALVAGGIGPGDEVLVSDFSFPATGNVVVQSGATPVFVDCRQDGFEMDCGDAQRKLTERTRAIMVVDPFGQPAPMAAAQSIARRAGLLLIEDAACALGATVDGVPCGGWEGAGCFSFHPRKILTTGEGGMLTTSDDRLLERAALLRSHGGVPGGIAMEFVENGYNYRMSEIQAALGVVQMMRLDAIVRDRRATAAAYLERIDGIGGVSVPLSTAAENCTFQSFVVLLDEAIDRDGVVRDLRAEGIEATLGTYAMHAQPAFARFGYRPGDLPHSWRAQRQAVTLPLLPGMAEEMLDRVVARFGAAVERRSAA